MKSVSDLEVRCTSQCSSLLRHHALDVSILFLTTFRYFGIVHRRCLHHFNTISANPPHQLAPISDYSSLYVSLLAAILQFHCFSTISANPLRFVTISILCWQILFIARHYSGTSFTISHYFALFRQMLLIARQYFGTISANALHCSSLFWHYFSLISTISHYFPLFRQIVRNSGKQ